MPRHAGRCPLNLSLSPKSKRIVRNVLIAVPAVLVGLFLLAIVIVNTPAFRNFLRSEIAKQAQAHMGAQIEVGALQMHWTQLGLDLHNVTIASSTAPIGAPPLLQAARLRVGVRLLPLLHGNLQLRDVIFDKPILHVAIDSRGRSNLPVSNRPSTGNGPTELFNLEIGDCAIHSGEIYYNDAQVPLEAELHDLVFQAGYNRFSGNYKGSFSYEHGRLATRQAIPMEHALRVQFTATRNGLAVENLLLTSGSSHVNLRANLTNYEAPVIDGSYEAQLFTGELAAAMRQASVPVGIVALSGKFGYRPSAGRPFLAAANVQGEMQSDKLLFRDGQQPLTVGSVRASYSLANADLQVTDLSATVLGGQLRANYAMRHLAAPVSASQLDASLRGVSLRTASDWAAPPNVQRIPFVGNTDADVRAAWSGSMDTAVAHLRLAISSRGEAAPRGVIPVNGLIQADYDGPQNRISFGQSHVQTASTNIAITGSLSSQKAGNSIVTVLAATGDLSEVGRLANMIASAMRPQAQPMSIPALAGSSSLTARITGSARDPHVQARLTAQNLHVDGTRWNSLALNATATQSQVSLQDGVLAGVSRQQVTFSGKAGLAHWSLYPDSPISVQATVANMSVADVQEIAQLDYPASGTISAKVSLRGTRAAPEGNASLVLTRAEAWNQPIDNFSANAIFHRGTVVTTVNLQTPAGSLGGNATYAIDPQQYQLKLHSNGIDLAKIAAIQERSLVQGTLHFDAAGAGTVHNPQLDAEISSSEIRVHDQAISNISAQLAVANQCATIALKSSVDQGEVEAKGDVELTGRHYATAAVDIRALPIAAVLANFLPGQAEKFGGQTEAHLTLRGPLSSPADMEAHLEVPTLNVTYGKAQLGLAKPLRADYANGTISLAPSQIQGTGTNLTFGGTIPVKSKAGYSLSADGTMDLGVLQSLKPGMRSSGAIEIHLRSQKTGAAPGMSGQLQIKNAVLTTESLPLGVENLNAQINLSGTRADIANFQGNAGGGKVSARGSVSYGKETSFDLALNADSVRIRYPEGLRSVLSGQINFQGSPAASALTGRVMVDSLSFTQDFDLSNFAGYFSQDSPGAVSSAFERNMRVNIAVQSSQNINLASSKLSMAGSANFRVAGAMAQPVLLGRISLSSGEVFFLGKRFEVQSGTIAFSNPARTDPVVNLYITTTVEQYNVTLNLNGPVDRLKTNYTSDPALPQADIIHLLAFGNTTEEAGSQPSQSPAMGAESVLAQGVGSQVAGKLENLTGVSQLTIDPLATNGQGDPGAQVALQERVTGNLLLTFSTNVTSTQNQAVELQYDLSRRMSITILRDQNGGYGLNLRLHKTF